MEKIALENVSFAYPGGEDLFHAVTLSFDTSWKLGLVGRNGRGKTTFLKIVAGELFAKGMATDVSCEYFPFEYCDTDTAYETAEKRGVFAWRLERETSLLNVKEEALFRPIKTLSNGERTKILLGLLFAEEKDFYLIDEPTNHLDSAGQAAVKAYLKQKSGYILVSHDEDLLRSAVDRILSLERCKITLVHCGYDAFLENREREEHFEYAQNERLLKEISALRGAAEEKSHWADKAEGGKIGGRNSKSGKKSGLRPDRGFIGHKAAKVMQSAKNFEARANRAAEEKEGLLKNVEREESLSLEPLVWRGGAMIVAKDLTFDYGSGAINAPISLELHEGTKTILSGNNGAGKTSLFRLLSGETVPYSGDFFRAAALKTYYLVQDTAMLSGKIADYAVRSGAESSLFFTILKKLGVERSEFGKNFEELSAGQKKKAALAVALSVKAHLYLFDEPYNDLDIYAKGMLTQAIRDTKATVIMIDHANSLMSDRGFKTISLLPMKNREG